MFLVALLMLLAPGLISLRIYWHGRTISTADYKYLVCDYIIFSFIILLLGYAILFISSPNRFISFSAQYFDFESNIYSAGFVVKYSVAALALSVVVPVIARKIVPKLFRRK